MADIVDMTFLLDSLIKIAVSAICGCLLGAERKSGNHAVGMRTITLISVSSTLLGIISYRTSGDPMRLNAAVINGIGFLGGGTILRQGLNIKGLTSAAIIWTAASLGIAISAGLFVQTAVITFLVIIMLFVLGKVEGKWFPTERSKEIHMVFDNDDVDIKKIKAAMENAGLVTVDMNVSRIFASHQILLHYAVKARREDDYSLLITELKEIGELAEFSITD